ncbi:MAG: sodium-independent anion transporter [Ferrovum sp. 37-45-19]|jgi:SulP family sulfate permease|uniref:SulP family inorganic anion transporter n=1 Tax=Ferrovum sp. JA12 TaxID=1356299 RepID=UPI00070255C9|nr:SulP family inorganic anion transporter [Ferrovum sp. JA12]OYV78777.1 MAG: sodium-independent anion transporter [Ferrovum sp. 21-44-67]OYV93917.1 MAG: sodium-independent anion transporter [Ferrovum sp. 37-45-19]OZB32015.1 MAG: sodium-independent anion transporter [Ferrovum sp. 34-44-207]HQT81974.1 SulP family inorganic anion transporter [Ferrovaceae bacterium]KRH78956.1 C4-dicarboxylic acid transporter DauA [Ferrovum sp. JA12]
MLAIQEAYRSGLFHKKNWLNNVLAGVIVGIVALPLAMAFAIASGAKPEQGLYTSIVAGLAVSLLGGSRLQIAGPTGAFIAILSGITAKYGFGGLQIATLMAGCILIAMGAAKLGGVIKYIPDPVITGFTSGIAIIIFVGQWKYFLGLNHVDNPELFHQKLVAIFHALPQLSPETTLLSCATLFILIVTPYVSKTIPAPFVAMVFATTIQWSFGLNHIATLGSTFGGIPQSLPSFKLLPLTYNEVIRLIGPAFTIALLGAIESLLSAVVADSMSNSRHDSNQELIGQGIANVLSPLFGGFAATGAIARTATNVKNGGNSPLSGIIHALSLVAIIVIFAPLASHIPLCALAAILFVVAYNMSEIKTFSYMLCNAPISDRLILLTTCFLTVFVDLVIAVNIGVVMAALLFMKNMSDSVAIESIAPETLNAEMNDDSESLPKNTVIYALEGPFFFGVAARLEHSLSSAHIHADALILRMGKVPLIDATGIKTLFNLADKCLRHHTQLVLCGANSRVMTQLVQSGITDKIGQHNLIQHISQWQLTGHGTTPQPTQHGL